MREITVSNWDDLHFAEGKRIAAEPGPDTVLQLNGQRVELALTDEHKRQLADVLAPYFEAGEKTRPVRRPGATGDRSRMAESRVYNKAMREWAEAPEQQGKYKITYAQLQNGKQGKPYYPEDLRRAYKAFLEQEGSAPVR
jgi:hypothetical protein